MMTMIERLGRREKIVLALGGGVAAGLVLIAFILLPYRDALRQLDGRIASRRAQIAEAQMLVQRLATQRGEAAMAERRLAKPLPSGLVPALETMVTQVARRECLIAARPQAVTPPAGFRQERVEVQLERLRLDQVVRLLHAIDTADAALQTDAVRMRPRYDDAALLDVSLTVSAFAKGGQ